MTEAQRWHWVGSRDAVRRAVEAALGSSPQAGRAAEAAGLVVVEARAHGPEVADLPHGHVFSGVRALKERRGLRVFVVVDADDRVGVQLARFCLCDGVLLWHAETGSLDAEELRGVPRGPKGQSLDVLLQRLEAGVQSSPRGETAVERLLRFETEDSLAQRLQDPETGLFDGAFATLKLDEEWKRSRRFHLPLSLVLLDLGAGVEDLAPAVRRGLLADAAGVFLNECRDIDVLSRFSPTTFLLLLPGTGPEGATVLARRMLEALRQRLAGRANPVVGIAAVPSSQIPDRKAFLQVAEACLRRAAAGGGDGGMCTSWQ